VALVVISLPMSTKLRVVFLLPDDSSDLFLMSEIYKYLTVGYLTIKIFAMDYKMEDVFSSFAMTDH